MTAWQLDVFVLRVVWTAGARVLRDQEVDQERAWDTEQENFTHASMEPRSLHIMPQYSCCRFPGFSIFILAHFPDRDLGVLGGHVLRSFLVGVRVVHVQAQQVLVSRRPGVEPNRSKNRASGADSENTRYLAQHPALTFWDKNPVPLKAFLFWNWLFGLVACFEVPSKAAL